MEILVRNAQKKDLPKIVRFNASMALETEDLQLDKDTLTAGVKAVFNDNNKGFYIIAELDGEVRGSLMITYEWSDWRSGYFWWIQSVYVEPGYRKKGLYRSMYSFLKNELQQDKKIVGLRLYVEKENKKAQKVYTTLGMNNSNYLLYEYSQEKHR